MFIAHAPMGYITSVLFLKRHDKLPVTASMIFFFGILGAVAPDFDMAYFYIWDNRQTHHHKYITHWPIVWATLLFVAVVLSRISPRAKAPWLVFIFSLGGFIHIILDSFVGDIWWFSPFINKPYAMFTVSARFSPWWLNFIIHWSFAVELVICVWAVFIYKQRKKRILLG